jgi:hypothetical protein
MDVVAAGTSNSNGDVYFDTNGIGNGNGNGNQFLSRAFSLGVEKFLEPGYGLVTGFSYGESVPEPSGLVLFGLGVAVFGWARRR